jgi:acyl-homoserine-lactone acylase
VLDGKTDFTPQTLIEAAYDSYLTGFEDLIPALVRAYDRTPSSNGLKAQLSEQIDLLRNWDLRFGVESVPTSLAIFWGQELMEAVSADARRAGVSVYDYMESRVSRSLPLEALAAATARLEEDFGTWRTPWGEINRFQRLTGDIDHPFDDDAPSIPVGFASGRWGSLASYGSRAREGTKKWYGTSGNSFVAVVEFGERVSARAITAGGQSGDPESPHFNDQALRYSTGDLRDVWFYRDDLEDHIEREYHPGG